MEENVNLSAILTGIKSQLGSIKDLRKEGIKLRKQNEIDIL